MNSTDIGGRIANGLKNYDLTLDELRSGSWFYCGGDSGVHLRYWQLRNMTKKMLNRKEWSFPNHEAYCVCGHRIEKNCYITNKKQILVIGNCCIKRFIKAKQRTCEVCGNGHRNKKFNLCDGCWTLIPAAFANNIQGHA